MTKEADLVLEEAYRMLSEEKEWGQGDPGWYDASGHGTEVIEDIAAVCLVGALSLAGLRLSLGHMDKVAAEARVERAIGRLPHGQFLQDWNDDPTTTKEDVLLALKKARYDFGDES